MKTFTLHFGRSRLNDIPILKHEVRSFLEEVANPRLKGYTILHGQGSWNGKFEDTTLLTVTGPETLEPTLTEIAREYASRFGQESVLLTGATVTDFALVSPHGSTFFPTAPGLTAEAPVLQ